MRLTGTTAGTQGWEREGGEAVVVGGGVRGNRAREHGNTTLTASIKVLQSLHASPLHASVGNID